MEEEGGCGVQMLPFQVKFSSFWDVVLCAWAVGVVCSVHEVSADFTLAIVN